MPLKKKTRILVTYSWCRTAYNVAESLDRAGYEVYTCDPSPWSMGRFSRHARGFDRVASPFKESERFIRDLLRIIAARGIDILLPVHEDALVIANARDAFPRDLNVICPPAADLSRAMDKNEIIAVATRAGVRVPLHASPGGEDEAAAFSRKCGFPVVVKTRRGNSGKGVFLAAGEDEVRTVFRSLSERYRLGPGSLPVIQEFVDGDLYGSCFLAKDGEVKACFLEKYLRWKEGKFGTSVLREPCQWPLLADYTRRMARALRWTGVGHFDFVAPRDRSFACLIEMNPRFWGALRLAIRNGYDFPLGLVTMAESGEPAPAAFVPREKPIRSLWILGELIAGVAEFRRGKILGPFRSLGRILLPAKRTAFDDFRWLDPLPFFSEMVHYGRSYFRSGCNINPIDEEMMR